MVLQCIMIYYTDYDITMYYDILHWLWYYNVLWYTTLTMILKCIMIYYIDYGITRNPRVTMVLQDGLWNHTVAMVLQDTL